jgi:hypothetical protein
MADAFPSPASEGSEDFAKTREHEYQDPHYHDEDADIVNDEAAPHVSGTPLDRKKTNRRPPPRRRYSSEDY